MVHSTQHHPGKSPFGRYTSNLFASGIPCLSIWHHLQPPTKSKTARVLLALSFSLNSTSKQSPGLTLPASQRSLMIILLVLYLKIFIEHLTSSRYSSRLWGHSSKWESHSLALTNLHTQYQPGLSQKSRPLRISPIDHMQFGELVKEFSPVGISSFGAGLMSAGPAGGKEPCTGSGGE